MKTIRLTLFKESLALTVGFTNFPMNEFGVKSESLKLKAEVGGLKKGDVILRVIDSKFGGEDNIININDLLTSYRSRKWRGKLELVIMRNQKQQLLVVNLLN